MLTTRWVPYQWDAFGDGLVIKCRHCNVIRFTDEFDSIQEHNQNCTQIAWRHLVNQS